MFSVEMLPAERGDCLPPEYGDPVRPHRVLIDGGPAATYPQLRERVLRIPPDQRHFELLVVAHIDQDHIEGITRLLHERGELGVCFGDVWFNGRRHLSEAQLGVADAEELTRLLQGHLPWNEGFARKAVVVPEQGALPTLRLPGGLQVTLLSPSPAALQSLLREWDRVVAERGRHSEAEETGEQDPSRLTLGEPDVERLAAAPFEPDRSRPNGSSIAFLAEYEGRRFLASGDAYPSTLAASLERGFSTSPEDPVRVHAFKPSHHGSRGSLSVELVRLMRCDHYLISTSGHRFKHPTQEAIARIVLHGSRGLKLWFNYATPFNEMWRSHRLRTRYSYQVAYPEVPEGGSRLLLSP